VHDAKYSMELIWSESVVQKMTGWL